MSSSAQKIAEAAEFLRGNGFDGRFDCAMVLGTGLGRLIDDLEAPVSLAYDVVPHFPQPSVSGHSGRIIAGRLERKRVLMFQGRAHYYETGDAAAMRVPIGVIAALGGPPLLLTNAAGSVKLDFRPSSHVIITDHINYSGMNPLLGDRSEGRFVPMAGAYDERLRKKLKLAAIGSGVTVNEGVYMWFSGPSFETAAEVRMARTLGADLVGMSTVPEVILARYFGLRVVALSLVTNIAAGVGIGAHTHQDTKTVVAGAAPTLRKLVHAFLARLDEV
ncbi:purine-nucleoside phosphorylase [Enterovirga sp.]|jgi:purine-nucleoside phosphorylase|uniref:purine-nucleoside phosphorylase n=1 Tax=Enterovirga sp. TaxID=2026350 RepID=UPI002637E964|nr:purine-nucleoside phosphorylase [Enterovirga sp.]MDB5593033.1 purine-nucleoside phosphorylase [Enterovirga sp.]